MGGQVHSWVEQTLDTLKETAGGASLTKPGSELFLSIMCLTTSAVLQTPVAWWIHLSCSDPHLLGQVMEAQQVHGDPGIPARSRDLQAVTEVTGGHEVIHQDWHPYSKRLRNTEKRPGRTHT